MPQGFIVLRVKSQRRMHKTGPKDNDRLAVEGRAVGEDCVFNAAFCYEETELLISGLRRKIGKLCGEEFRSE